MLYHQEEQALLILNIMNMKIILMLRECKKFVDKEGIIDQTIIAVYEDLIEIFNQHNNAKEN